MERIFRIFQDVGAEDENRIGSIEDRLSRTEEAVQNLQTQMSLLNAAVERALSSLLPKVESLLRRDASATVLRAASCSCQKTLPSHSQKGSIRKAHTSAQEEPKPTTSMREVSLVSYPSLTSVTEAAEVRDAVALRRILANGGDAHQRDTNGVPALHLAAAKGYVEAVWTRIWARLHLTDPEQRLALLNATAEGHVNVVRRLLEAGSEVEVKDSQGNTPLSLAVNAKNWQIVHLLLEKGADPNARDFEGKSALWVAAKEGEIETVNLMLRNKKPDNVLACLALSYAKNASVVQAFEEALPGIIMEWGGWAMREAARHGRLESMVALLDTGVDINCNDKYRYTALIYASWYGRVECVNELVRRGAFLNGADSVHEHTALHVASMNGHEHVVRVLLDAGADATKRDWIGKTALQLARTDAVKNIIRRHINHSD